MINHISTAIEYAAFRSARTATDVMRRRDRTDNEFKTSMRSVICPPLSPAVVARQLTRDFGILTDQMRRDCSKNA